jgi:Rieske Fe-S protein
MASRREVIAGTFGMMAVAACEPEKVEPKDSGGEPLDPVDPTDTDTGTPPTTTDTGTPSPTGDTGTPPPPPCEESSISDAQIVLCLGEFPQLEVVGGALTVDSSQGEITVIRVDGTTVSTVSNICTHLGCALVWRASESRLHCGCHGSQFSADGAVLRGPASRALESWPTTLVGETVTIDLTR